MKLVTWNCNCSFRKKIDHLRKIDFDVAVIQECEKEIKDLPETWEYLWIGNNKNKGLAVIGRGNRLEIDKNYDSSWSYFLPVSVNKGEWFLLAVWAYNHRATKRFGENATGYPLEIFEQLSEYLQQDNAVVMGDFNNSVVWDKPNNDNRFMNIAETLQIHGLSSAYHSYNGENFGKETHKTFFHNKKESIGHHIDYIFVPESRNITSLDVGQYSEWIKISDHVPLQIEIK